MDLVITAIFLGALGLVMLAWSAEAIKNYGDRVMADMDTYVDFPTLYNGSTTAKQFPNSYLAESIWKVRDDCIESPMVGRSDKRHELFELLERAAMLADEIRYKG